jgi:hypothetical protein
VAAGCARARKTVSLWHQELSSSTIYTANPLRTPSAIAIHDSVSSSRRPHPPAAPSHSLALWLSVKLLLSHPLAPSRTLSHPLAPSHGITQERNGATATQSFRNEARWGRSLLRTRSRSRRVLRPSALESSRLGSGRVDDATAADIGSGRGGEGPSGPKPRGGEARLAWFRFPSACSDFSLPAHCWARRWIGKSIRRLAPVVVWREGEHLS